MFGMLVKAYLFYLQVLERNIAISAVGQWLRACLQ
jgi:hypothetical protein